MRRLKEVEDEDRINDVKSSVKNGDITSASDVDECPECNSTNIIEYEHEGEIVCDDCGLVITDSLIDYGPEWRVFSDDNTEEKRRTGPPRTELRHDRGTTSTIDWRDQDARGNTITAEKQQQMHRLRRLDQHAKRNSGERRIAYANGEIKRMGSILGAPKNIQETAAALYREAHNKDMISGRSIEAITSACLYIALRVHNEPRSLDEVAEVSRVDKKPIQSSHQYLTRELDIALEPVNPGEYIQRFAAKLSLPQSVIRIAEQLLNEIVDTHHASGNHPGVLAASALYAAGLVDGNLVTQKAMTEASNITEVSIRNNYPMFLTETDYVDIDPDVISNATTPKDVSKHLNNEPVSYLSHTTKYEHANKTTQPNNESENGNGNGYTCNICTTKFDTERELLDHRNEAHNIGTDYNDTEYNFHCSICSYTSDTYHAVRVHIGRAHPHFDPESNSRRTFAVNSDEQPPESPNPTIFGTLYSCEFCEQTYETLDELHTHQDTTHDGDRNDNNNALIFYNDIHHKQPLYACPDCNTTTETPAALESHLRTDHTYSDYNHTQTYRVEFTCEDFTTTICTNSPVPESAPFDTHDHTVNDKQQLVTTVCESFSDTQDDFHSLVKSLTASVIGVGGIHLNDPDQTRTYNEAVANATYAVYNYAINTVGQNLDRPTVYGAFDVDDTDIDTFIAYQDLLEWMIETAPHSRTGSTQ